MKSIKDIRISLGLTQKEFAKEFHIPFGTLKRWEYGENRTPGYVIYMIERILSTEHTS